MLRLIKKIKNRINIYNEFKFNNKIIRSGRSGQFSKFNEINENKDYWEQVSWCIKQESMRDGGVNFFKNKVVIDHLASENADLGYRLLNKIIRHPLGDRMLGLISTPSWGSPFLLKRYPYLSPTTASHIANIISINDAFQEDIAQYKSFVEFGGGYGGLARAMLTVSPTTNVLIVDHSSMHQTQIQYLSQTMPEKYVVNNVHYFEAVNEIKQNRIDIFNASFSFSELPLVFRQDIESFILENCLRLHIIFQNYFRGVDNLSYMNNFSKRLERAGWDIVLKSYDWYGPDSARVLYGRKLS